MSRRTLIFLIAAAGLLAAILIPLNPAAIIPDNAGGITVAKKFFSAALSPALTYEAAENLPPGTSPLLAKVLAATFATFRYGLAGISLALLLGLPLTAACLTPRQNAGKLRHATWRAARFLAALLRSIHELFWAILLLAAFGNVPALAVLALALPYAGTFAKILPEIIAGSPARAESHLHSTGAPPSLSFLLGRLPGAIPDLTAYILYRFECSLRSAAVMGFLGIPTLGYYLKLSFANLHYQECWSYLYALGILVLAAEAWGSFIRARLVSPPASAPLCIKAALPADPLARLRALRPRDCLVRATFAIATISATISIAAPDLKTTELFLARRWENAARFLTETIPYALRDTDPTTTLGSWLTQYALGTGLPAAWQTLLLAIVAIVLSAATAAILIPPASATIATADPFGITGGHITKLKNLAWKTLRLTARGICVFIRAIPEYVWAFLLLAALGSGAWPLVIALVLHNAGILGRLGAELVENVPPRTPAVLAATGANRITILLAAILPDIFPRALAYFFYRWETCVRESSVLGLLGLPSLGFAISEARARTRYDEMLLYLLISVLLVLLGDAISHRLRTKS